MKKFWFLGIFLATISAFIVAWMSWSRTADQIIALDPNGFRGVYLIPAIQERAELYLIIQSGEMDNTGTPGLPHYVEHLAWLNSVGTADAPKDRHTNAFTSPDATIYFLSVRPDDAAQAVNTLAKVLAPLPPESDFMRRERDVILREYDQQDTENPMKSHIIALLAASYGADPRARSVIGDPADIARFSLDEARAWHSATHRRENAVWVIYGNIDPSDAEAWIWQAFPELQVADAALPAPPRDFDQGAQETLVRTIIDPRFGSPVLNFHKTVRLAQKMDYTAQLVQLDLLFDILDSTLTGSYAKPLRFDAMLAQSYGLALRALTARDLELAFWDARPDVGVSLTQLQSAIEAAIQSAVQIPPETFDRVKARWIKRLEGGDPSYESFTLTLDAIAARQTPVAYADYLRAARAISLDDVTALSRAIAGPGRIVVDHISPQ